MAEIAPAAPPSDMVVAARRRDRGEDRSEPPAKAPAKSEPPAEKTPVPTPESKAPVPGPDAKQPAAAEVAPKPDVWTDAEVIAALRDCVKLLGPIAAEVDVAQPLKHEQCGAAAPVLLRRVGIGPRSVEINPPATVNCAMVAKLAVWVDKTLQPLAQDMLGAPITRLRNASGYSCRNRNGSHSHSDKLSEHALANAIDIAGFVTADGRSIEVARHWGPTVRDQREARQDRRGPAQGPAQA